MNYAEMLDFGKLIAAGPCQILSTITAGAGQDNVAQNGAAIDRFATNITTRHRGGALIVTGKATVAAGQQLTIAAKIQTDDNSGFTSPTDLVTKGATAVVDGGGGGVTNQPFTLVIPFKNIEQAERYIRGVVTPDLTASGTDTALVASLFVFGGSDRIAPH